MASDGAALPTGIVARVHLAPPASARLGFLEALARYLYVVNAAWLHAQLLAGLRPPERLLLAEPPWTSGPVRYVTHHGRDALGRERVYYDGPTAMHMREATCIDLASYDAAAMAVLAERPALPHTIGTWPDVHFAVRIGSKIFDTSTRAGALASLKG